MYRVIMVPVDGSAFSREAVFQGLRLARKSGAQLRLVRVASIAAMPGGPDTLALESAAWTIERDDLRAQLHRLTTECRSNSQVDVSAHVEEGPIADALRGHALRHGVDLIVMATHARRGMARAFLGTLPISLSAKPESLCSWFGRLLSLQSSWMGRVTSASSSRLTDQRSPNGVSIPQSLWRGWSMRS